MNFETVVKGKASLDYRGAQVMELLNDLINDNEQGSDHKEYYIQLKLAVIELLQSHGNLNSLPRNRHL